MGPPPHKKQKSTQGETYGENKRGRTAGHYFCVFCGNFMTASLRICKSEGCGKPIHPLNRCGHCHEFVQDAVNHKYCRFCGKQLDEYGLLPPAAPQPNAMKH